MLANNLKRPAKKIEIIFAAVFGFALSLLLYTGQYLPKKQQAMRLETDIAAINKEIETLEKFNQTIRENREKQIQEMSSQIQKSAEADPKLQVILKSRAPEFRLFEDFMRQIMSPLFRPSVDVQSFTYEARLEHTGFSETAFSFSASGPYVNVLMFIKRLEQVPALVTVRDFDLKVDRVDTNLVTITVKAAFFELQDDKV